DHALTHPLQNILLLSLYPYATIRVMKQRWLRVGLMTSLLLALTGRALADQAAPVSAPTPKDSTGGRVTQAFPIRDALWVLFSVARSSAANPPTTQPDFPAEADRLTQ